MGHSPFEGGQTSAGDADVKGSEKKRGLMPGEGLITDHDIYLFKEGSHFKLYEKLGSHIVMVDGVPGVFFSVWAPNAEAVSVVGDFNGWKREAHPLTVREDRSGIWEGFLPHLGKGTVYKYHIRSRNHYRVDKGDPFAFLSEPLPKRPPSFGRPIMPGKMRRG